MKAVLRVRFIALRAYIKTKTKTKQLGGILL